VRKLIAMLIVGGLLAGTGLGCGGDTGKKDKDSKPKTDSAKPGEKDNKKPTP
jgi:hypothetical protein